MKELLEPLSYGLPKLMKGLASERHKKEPKKRMKEELNKVKR